MFSLEDDIRRAASREWWCRTSGRRVLPMALACCSRAAISAAPTPLPRTARWTDRKRHPLCSFVQWGPQMDANGRKYERAGGFCGTNPNSGDCAFLFTRRRLRAGGWACRCSSVCTFCRSCRGRDRCGRFWVRCDGFVQLCARAVENWPQMDANGRKWVRARVPGAGSVVHRCALRCALRGRVRAGLR